MDPMGTESLGSRKTPSRLEKKRYERQIHDVLYIWFKSWEMMWSINTSIYKKNKCLVDWISSYFTWCSRLTSNRSLPQAAFEKSDWKTGNSTSKSFIPSGKLTWQWKMNLLKMYDLLKMGIFHCYVSLPEDNLIEKSLPTLRGPPPTKTALFGWYPCVNYWLNPQTWAWGYTLGLRPNFEK